MEYTIIRITSRLNGNSTLESLLTENSDKRHYVRCLISTFRDQVWLVLFR